MQIPPQVSAADFTAAIREFEAAIGVEWVFKSDADLALYKDAYSPFWGEPEERVAYAALAPASDEQVQLLMRIANRYRIPMYPISTGRNLGYGASAPVLSGSVVLDLKRMNRVLEINEENAYVLVEPGVSYFDLYRYIRELWRCCPHCCARWACAPWAWNRRMRPSARAARWSSTNGVRLAGGSGSAQGSQGLLRAAGRAFWRIRHAVFSTGLRSRIRRSMISALISPNHAEATLQKKPL